MAVNILTHEDLEHFKNELFMELKELLLNDQQPQKKWLKSDEVKKLLNVSSSTLQTLRINGTLQYSKIGGIIYYDFDHIEKTLQKNLKLAIN